MPRPATKRSRQTAKTKTALPSQDIPQLDPESPDIPKSPANNILHGSRPTHSAHPSEIIHQLRHQTPQSKAHDFAIESSPTGEHGATGSRPPTRARGYSSTLSLAGRKADINSKIPGTPAFESSVLSNFRRRPRQASILHMMQDEDGSSDLDDEDFLGGLSPEDESTPLNLSRGKSLVIRKAVSPSPTNPSTSSSGKSSKRKRPITSLEDPQSVDIIDDDSQSPTPGDLSREPDILVDLPRPFESSMAFSETLIPPMSSPPLESPRINPILASEPQSPSNQQQTSTPELLVSSKKTHISTAALQDKFLPRRRQRRLVRGNGISFEVLSDSDEDIPSAAQDDDELSYMPIRRPSRPRKKGADKQKSSRISRAPQAVSKASKPVQKRAAITLEFRSVPVENLKESQTPLEVTKPAAASADKENELTDISSPLSTALDSDEFDSDFELHPTTHFLSEELRLQALKFTEVDKWQMEFEDVIVAGA